MNTRRGFLGMLAGLPFVGAMFGTAKADMKNPQSVPRSCYLQDGLWLAVKHDMDHPFIPWKKVGDIGDDVAVIRWISVTERLPTVDANSNYKEVLVCSGENRVIEQTVIRHSDEGFYWCVPGVTHWAELPSPPTTN